MGILTEMPLNIAHSTCTVHADCVGLIAISVYWCGRHHILPRELGFVGDCTRILIYKISKFEMVHISQILSHMSDSSNKNTTKMNANLSEMLRNHI